MNKGNPHNHTLKWLFTATAEENPASWPLLPKLGSVETSRQLTVVCWTLHLRLGGFRGLRLSREAPKEHEAAFQEQQHSQAASRGKLSYVCCDKQSSGCHIQKVGASKTGRTINPHRENPRIQQKNKIFRMKANPPSEPLGWTQKQRTRTPGSFC